MYKESDVLNKIRSNCLKNLFWTIVALLFFSIFLIGGLFYTTDEVSMWFAIIVGGIGVVYNLNGLIKGLIPVFNTESLSIFKEIKSIKELTEIINDTYKNKLYEDNEIVMSKEYLVPKNCFEGTTKILDIIWVYEYDHDKYTRYGKQARLRVMNIYCFNTTSAIPYNVKDISKLRSAIFELNKINPNIITGYSSQNKKKYDQIVNKGKVENTLIECKVCGKKITYNEYETCDECHEKIMDRLKQKEEQNKNSDKNKTILKTDKDEFEQIKKYKELLDDGIITEEEFNKKKKELLNL